MVILHCIMNSRETREEIPSEVAARNNAGSMNVVRGDAAASLVSCLLFVVFRWLTEEYEISVAFELDRGRTRPWNFDE